MEPELGSVDFMGEKWNKHECVPTNKCVVLWTSRLHIVLGCSLYIKIVVPTLLGGGPWSLC